MVFNRADILIPNKHADRSKWAVIACDQYTSEPEYWEKAKTLAGHAPSALHVIIPEVYLEDKDVDKRIEKVKQTMNAYLSQGLMDELKQSVIYVERTQPNGKVRRGIVGMVDLEEYSYAKDSQSLIRATEGTVLERIPPRVRVREHAALELPHVMLLIDDESKTVIDWLGSKVESSQKVYDFELMLGGGHIKGFQLSDKQVEDVFRGLEKLADNPSFNQKYGIKNKATLLFCVGDGNHSLATAKACWEKVKKTLTAEEAKTHPARFALAEVVNVHSEALEFEPIHRLLFEVKPEHVLEQLKSYYSTAESGNGQTVRYVYAGKNGQLTIQNPKSNLTVGSLQMFIDDYLKKFGGKVDYIHGDGSTVKLAQKAGCIGFLLPNMDKCDLFKSVILDGVLPRKTFSMGHSDDKRFYLEARKIVR